MRIPLCSSTIRSDSTSFFFAMGSIPLLIISWMQSHALSRRTSTDIYRSNRLSKCKNKTLLNNSFYWHENKTLHSHLPCTSKNFNDVQVLLEQLQDTYISWQSTKIILKFACVLLQSLKRQIIILHCICNSRVFKRILNNCCCTIFSHDTELHGQRPYSLGPSDKGGPQACTLGTSFIKMLRELAFTGGLGPIQ